MLDGKLLPIRLHDSRSRWIRSLSVDNVKCLIVCRGPVRREAIGVFDQIRIAADGAEAMTHRALDARAGKARVSGMALALDGIVDDADGLAGTHVHRADCVEEQGCVLFEHVLWSPGNSVGGEGEAVETFGATGGIFTRVGP